MFKSRGTGAARKLVLPVAVAALLTLPASADAGLRSYQGQFDKGGIARFEMKITDTGARKIVRWRWRDVPIVCAKGGKQQHSGYFEKPWLAVNEKTRTFYGHAQGTTEKDFAEVNGRFPNNWRRAEGTLQIEGDTSVGQNCTTGAPQHWEAHRLPRD